MLRRYGSLNLDFKGYLGEPWYLGQTAITGREPSKKDPTREVSIRDMKSGLPLKFRTVAPQLCNTQLGTGLWEPTSVSQRKNIVKEVYSKSSIFKLFALLNITWGPVTPFFLVLCSFWNGIVYHILFPQLYFGTMSFVFSVTA